MFLIKIALILSRVFRPVFHDIPLVSQEWSKIKMMVKTGTLMKLLIINGKLTVKYGT